MIKCNLINVELEELSLIFKRINSTQDDIEIGLKAHEDYAALVNEINSLDPTDTRRGELLCRDAIDQLEIMWDGEIARMEKEMWEEELVRMFKKSSMLIETDYAAG